MPLALFLIASDGSLIPFTGITSPPPPPPPPPFEVYVDGVFVDLANFGVEADGTPYYDTAGPDAGEEATFGVDNGGNPYLEYTP